MEKFVWCSQRIDLKYYTAVTIKWVNVVKILSFLNRRLTKMQTNHCIYSNTCVKQPLSKRPKIGFQDRLLLNAGQKYCRMLPLEHSAILLTFIKLPFVLKIFVLSFFVWPFYTGFTVHALYCKSPIAQVSIYLKTSVRSEGLFLYYFHFPIISKDILFILMNLSI